jgi:hypothetical protein
MIIFPFGKLCGEGNAVSYRGVNELVNCRRVRPLSRLRLPPATDPASDWIFACSCPG